MQTQLQERKQKPRLFRIFFGLLIATTSLVGAFFLDEDPLHQTRAEAG